MKVGINAQTLSFEKNFRNAGLSRYIYNLIKGLAGIDDKNEYYIFVQQKVPEFIGKKNFHFIRTSLNTRNPKIRILWEHLILPWLLLKYKIKVVHGPINILPFFCPTKSVVTTHDITFLTYSKGHKSKDWYQNILTKRSVKKAKAVISTSNETIEEILRFYKIKDSKIVKIYDGVSERFKIVGEKEKKRVKDKYDLPDKFILSISTLEPRKNYLRQIEAFRLLQEKGEIGKEWKYVIFGGRGWKCQKILRKIKATKGAIYPGFIDDEDIVGAYNLAEGFLFCSLKEGFGLPILEAMACGCPVVTSKMSSTAEIAGKAAKLVNPLEINEIKEGIREIVKNKKLKKELMRKGLERVKEFSWEKTAEGTLKLYEKVRRK